MPMPVSATVKCNRKSELALDGCDTGLLSALATLTETSPAR